MNPFKKPGQTKWTPGPWTTKPGRKPWICTVGNNLNDPAVWSDCPIAVGEPFPNTDKQADANLIAAAPDLYQALSNLMAPFGGDIQRKAPALFEGAIAALSKARGERS